METLRELKPQGYLTPSHITAEFQGKRFLLTHCNDFYTAERVACDYQAKFPLASYYVGNVYNSTCIDGKAKAFREFYKGGAK